MAYDRGIITEKLSGFLDETVEDLIKSYENKGLRASGQFARDIKHYIATNGLQIKAAITAPLQSYFMQRGRQSNQSQTLGQVRFLGRILEQWVKDKSIDVNPYAAAHKIVHYGIQVPNRHNPGGVISDVINEKWFEKLNQLIRGGIIGEIRSDVLEQFNQ